jgi:predicted amidophosphoribosyltransferase
MNSFAEIVDSVEIELLGRRGLSFARAVKYHNWEMEPKELVCWRCAGSIGPHESDGDGCATCRSTKLSWDRSLRLGRYEGIVKDAVIDLKFRKWRLTGKELGQTSGKVLERSINELGWSSRELLIVPVPMPNLRRVMRGIDHTQVIAQGASHTSGVRVSRLLGARNRPEQVGLSATDRLKNIKGGFMVSQSKLQKALAPKAGIRALVVLDDVRTTGATIGEACRVLRRAIKAIPNARECEIWGFSVARAGEQNRASL